MRKKIIGGFEVEKREIKERYKHKIQLVHGTVNVAIPSILQDGFKVDSKDIQANGAHISGRMFGDGVYFAKPEQISKVQFYQSNDKVKQNWIIVADVFYNDLDTNRNYTNVAHGHLKLAKRVGQYSRDEYIVRPEQIQIRYILETD